ncbi:PEP/pyruvate-binding domain-containing protein [Paractinoplanes hotanensis]|uniref:PEP-utilizing enzyme n=1 Tax=Paractinoplanes hotanensis TaxID=2906497 RepID=A0ABT0XVC9_9ACTN|nr:PEP/pyruvate-binding domain-containing protein [Actinoplanes hotanensis]MCM4077752.1 PEP-utilizing enzyme [Actinoplanes hotanensis]
MPIFDLHDVSAAAVDRVGGKAAALGELLRAGERVPPGFCLTAEAGPLPVGEIIAAYERLGGGAVAVRSSATVEDAPDASYAGMFDTVLDVHGPEALLAAVETCRASASNARVRAYGQGEIRMGVVIQRMTAAERAGVLFTANPLTGRRTEMLVESAEGNGSTVVDGRHDVDRRLVGQDDPLWAVGQRLQALFGSPQDVEWAIDEHGELWILQSRPITTLFPPPPPADGPPRVYLEFGHVQGMLQPVTPMGMNTLQELIKAMLAPLGLRVEIVDIGGRLYGDLSDLVRDPVARRRLVPLMAVDFGPRAQAVMRHVLDDPRFAPRKGPRKKRDGGLPPIGRAVRGILGALANPDRARARLDEAVERIRLSSRGDAGTPTTEERLRLVREHDQSDSPDAIIWPIVAGMLASALPPRLLGDVARPGEIHAVLGGMPHNVTIEMDLALWRLARDAGSLDDIDLGDFLDRYGHRAAAEVDLGVPRWSEDPTPVRAALANLMRVTDPEQAPDRRFARAAERAEATLLELGARARRHRPVRGRLAIFLLGRARRLAGLRETGKFAGLYRLAEMRRHLLAVGADLTAAGVLSRPGDIMFLTLDEADNAARTARTLRTGDAFDGDPGSGHRQLIADRRAEYDRESRRRSVPVALLSDGTDIEAVLPSADDPGALRGVGASAGRATGPVRVVHDPATARLEPGEVLVTSTTDPGWTPLFLTASALVTETGAVMAHGPTVAREYGIPAVICVPGATRHLRTGQIVTVDAAAGTVTVVSDVAAVVQGSS